MPLAEVGYFKAKAYLVDPRGWQHWPDGPDVGISVHPDRYRTANILYCAFPRMFGETKAAVSTRDEKLAQALAPLDKAGYTVIPPSGKLRDLTEQLPHIFDTLGCRILHLLPVNPTPTTYARFGRFGSPYAALDLTAIDPALVVFDKRTTGMDQFRELTYQTHLHGGRVFLDIVINHTGWGSVLQEKHPEWFLRQPDGTFVSPGAWGVTWEDLVELKHQNVGLWDELAEMFLTWCRRGVDGFRCDAGYKVPVPAWQYIIARVQQEYPETLFLLEGLGGAWEATEALLTEGGMQWAYSELFQNYSGPQVASYLEHSLQQSERVGLLVHYSETHDNERLAARGRAWSLLRNRLCALTSVSGGFGFTCGVEWLATEKISVHGSTGMAWGNADNLVPELARLNQLLGEHPCFFDGAKLTRLSAADSPVYALRRESEEGKDAVLVLVNTDVERAHSLALNGGGDGSFPQNPFRAVTCPGEPSLPHSQGPVEDKTGRGAPAPDPSIYEVARWVDLLGQTAPELKINPGGQPELHPPARRSLLPCAHKPAARNARRSVSAGQAANGVGPDRLEPYAPGREHWQARLVRAGRRGGALACRIPGEDFTTPERSAAFRLQQRRNRRALEKVQLPPSETSAFGFRTSGSPSFPWSCLGPCSTSAVSRWFLPEHWLLIQDTAPFRAALIFNEPGLSAVAKRRIPSGAWRAHCLFCPRQTAGDATLLLERYTAKDQHVQAAIRFLPPLAEPRPSGTSQFRPGPPHQWPRRHGPALCRPRPHPIQIRLCARGQLAPDPAGGPAYPGQTHPRVD